jgi:hypothetical protein
MDFWKWLSNQRDRAAAIVLVTAGAVAIVLGWLGVSRSVIGTQQLPYLASGAVGGLFLLGGGATLWLSCDLRDEWRKLDEIQTEIRDAVAAQSVALENQSAALAALTNGHDRPVIASGSSTGPAGQSQPAGRTRDRKRPLSAPALSRPDGDQA